MCRSKQAREMNQSNDSIVTDDEQSKTLLQKQMSTISNILIKNAMTDDNVSIGANTRYVRRYMYHII